ncbi:MAG: RluA family pseudouridine synthase [Betaproteobacteria bacterium]
MDEPHRLIADRGDAGQRLDLVLRRHLAAAGATRTRIQTWIADGRVAVNGRGRRRAAARVASGDIITVAIPDELPGRRPMAAEDRTLDVLYEDAHLLVVDKPPGVVVHPTYKHADGTMMNALLWRARTWPAGGRPSIVGRLDKLTSGIVLVAKRREVHAALQRAMSSPRAEKDYLAVVYGRMNRARGRIDLPLGRDRRDPRKVVVSAGGTPSLTLFERIARAAARREGLALVRCSLVTGRRHQIRVHLAARGWPIVGDPVYGEPRWTHVADAGLAATLRTFPRQALHAWRLALRHPATGERLVVTSRVPDDIAALLGAAGLQRATLDRLLPV